VIARYRKNADVMNDEKTERAPLIALAQNAAELLDRPGVSERCDNRPNSREGWGWYFKQRERWSPAPYATLQQMSYDENLGGAL
jgi:hypothetical protein